ncbi:4806_t:CDS:2 [Gigaspora margarita]|uniref:4806_t:CDS:1 n=1 Tax=Gigaspora margarita TaxID=4874 RepID=A0ABN7UGZ7_GIGMA|nr:4806_t:CDS:2 [Gigaspora margarita]
MKKVHNTRSNGKETITALQKTIHPEMGAKLSVSSGTASPSTTGLTSSDWLEIIEGESVAKNLQRELEVDDTPAKNSTGFDMEGSGNLCDGRSCEVISPNLHTGVSNINIDAIFNSNKKLEMMYPTRKQNHGQETEVVEQNIQMDDVANLLETEKVHSSIYIERVKTFVNVEPSITLSLALNKGNIALVNLMANNRKSTKKVNNTSHNQPNPINSMNKDITQPKENDEFTKVTYSKKKKKIRNPALPATSDRSEILQYIRDQFEALYQDKPVDIEAIEALTNDLLSVLQQQNKALIKEISLQEITDTINRLLNYKAPGSDGLTYEFYKTFYDEVSPILKNDLNIMGDTAKNLTIANATNYLKKLSTSSTLTQTNFFSESDRKENWAWSLTKWVYDPGESIRNPWGIIQSLPCCGIKKRVQNVLYQHLKEQIPFADEGIHLEYPPERIEDRINAIEQRHKALEFLLQDYVVNVNILYDKDIDNRFYKHSKIKNDKLLKEEGLE